MADPFELNQPFVRVGDTVCLAKPDGDGHVLTREDDGEITEVEGRDKITVTWRNGEVETLHEDHLDMI